MDNVFKIIFLAVLISSHAICEELATIRNQFIQSHLISTEADSTIKGYVDAQTPDGTWDDIDYESQVESDWPIRSHLDILKEMSIAYFNPTSSFYNQTEIRDKIVLGLKYWLDNDIQNPNWFNIEIGIPKRIGEVMVLMGGNIPQAMIDQSFTTVFSSNRTWLGKRGQNGINKAGVEIMKGWLLADLDHIKNASESMADIIEFTTSTEGLQEDFSWHQHLAQSQFGTYGLSFLESVSLWAYTLRGTESEFAPTKIELVRTFALDGISWFLRNDILDLNACGRKISVDRQSDRGIRLHNALKVTKQIDPSFSAEYDLRLSLNGFIGSKYFWRSDISVHRQANWQASIRMCSDRLIGAESTNDENVQGLHSADGVLLLHQTGQEYLNIAALWDWKRPPGTTIDQGIENLRPNSYSSTTPNTKGRTPFVGGVADGDSGVSAMHYVRDSLSAHKAWFVEEDSIICLGTGINGNTLAEVITSVEQSHLIGEVNSSEGSSLALGVYDLPQNSWINHNNIGYKIGQASVLDLREVNSNWNTIFLNGGDLPVNGEIFSIYHDHGQNPENEIYSYVIYPDTSSSEMSTRINEHDYTILANTTKLQAIEDSSVIKAVFYSPGTLITSKGTMITASKPCIVQLNDDSMLISDPTQKLHSIIITIDNKPITISLPSGRYAGKQVEIDIADIKAKVNAVSSEPKPK